MNEELSTGTTIFVGEAIEKKPGNVLVTNIANLFKVKSLVTLALVGTFVAITLRGDVSATEFIAILSSVIGYFFGTKNPEKKE